MIRAILLACVISLLLIAAVASCGKKDASESSGGVARARMEQSTSASAKSAAPSMPLTKGKSAAVTAGGAPTPPPAPAKPVAGEGQPMMGSAETAVPNAPAGATSGVPPKIIHTGQVALEVEDVKRAEKGVRELVERNGGYVSDASMSYSEGAGSGGTLTLKLPAESYAATYADLTEGTYGHLLRGEEKAEDVTEEWVDVDTRIRLLADQRDQVRELLKRQGSLSDIMQVQREVLGLQTQIETAEGRLNYLRARVELSTIIVELRLRADESQLVRAEREAGKWMPLRVLERAVSVLVWMLQRLANVLIYVGTLFPCWGTPALLAWLIYRRTKRARSAA